jgi:hypothetical protein
VGVNSAFWQYLLVNDVTCSNSKARAERIVDELLLDGGGGAVAGEDDAVGGGF